MMKFLAPLTIALAFSGAAGANIKTSPCDELFGTVNYDDVTDQGQRVARQEKFKFRSWSPEEQFDQILVRQSPEIPDASGLQVRVEFPARAEKNGRAKGKDVVRNFSATAWNGDRKFFILGDLNMKHLVRHEAANADRFVVAVEKNNSPICEKSFAITRGH